MIERIVTRTNRGVEFSAEQQNGKAIEKATKIREHTEVIEQRAELNQLQRALEKSTSSRAAYPIADRYNLSRTLAAGIFALSLHAADVFAEEGLPEKNYTPEQTQILEKVTGMSFPELNAKFAVDMPIAPGPEGKYIIHIGQTHEHPGFGL